MNFKNCVFVFLMTMLFSINGLLGAAASDVAYAEMGSREDAPTYVKQDANRVRNKKTVFSISDEGCERRWYWLGAFNDQRTGKVGLCAYSYSDCVGAKRPLIPLELGEQSNLFFMDKNGKKVQFPEDAGRNFGSLHGVQDVYRRLENQGLVKKASRKNHRRGNSPTGSTGDSEGESGELTARSTRSSGEDSTDGETTEFSEKESIGLGFARTNALNSIGRSENVWHNGEECCKQRHLNGPHFFKRGTDNQWNRCEDPAAESFAGEESIQVPAREKRRRSNLQKVTTPLYDRTIRVCRIFNTGCADREVKPYMWYCILNDRSDKIVKYVRVVLEKPNNGRYALFNQIAEGYRVPKWWVFSEELPNGWKLDPNVLDMLGKKEGTISHVFKEGPANRWTSCEDPSKQRSLLESADAVKKNEDQVINIEDGGVQKDESAESIIIEGRKECAASNDNSAVDLPSDREFQRHVDKILSDRTRIEYGAYCDRSISCGDCIIRRYPGYTHYALSTMMLNVWYYRPSRDGKRIVEFARLIEAGGGHALEYSNTLPVGWKIESEMAERLKRAEEEKNSLAAVEIINRTITNVLEVIGKEEEEENDAVERAEQRENIELVRQLAEQERRRRIAELDAEKEAEKSRATLQRKLDAESAQVPLFASFCSSSPEKEDEVSAEERVCRGVKRKIDDAEEVERSVKSIKVKNSVSQEQLEKQQKKAAVRRLRSLIQRTSDRRQQKLLRERSDKSFVVAFPKRDAQGLIESQELVISSASSASMARKPSLLVEAAAAQPENAAVESPLAQKSLNQYSFMETVLRDGRSMFEKIMPPGYLIGGKKLPIAERSLPAF